MGTVQLTATTAYEMALAGARGESLVPFLADLADLVGADAGVGLTTWVRSGASTMLHTAIAGADGDVHAPAFVATVTNSASPHPALPLLTLERAVRVDELALTGDAWSAAADHRLHTCATARWSVAILLQQTPTAAVFLGGHRLRRDFTDAHLRLFELVQRPVVAALAFRAALDANAALLGRGNGHPPRGSAVAAPPWARSQVADYQPTRREAEVLAMAAFGWTNVRIARRLGITERTVRKHLSSVYDHSGQQGRAAATAWWARQRTEGQPAPTPTPT